MNLFICHTPLHVLISWIVANNDPLQTESTFITIEDSSGLGEIATRLLAGHNIKHISLPGDATKRGPLERLITQRANAKFIEKSCKSLKGTVFVFHDLRAEAQSLLNSRPDLKFILLEDGVAIYDTRGLIMAGPIGVLKRKLLFGMRWKHATEIGMHPRISEIGCFYPSLLRKNLRDKRAFRLPQFPSSPLIPSLLSAANPPSNPYALIALPHTQHTKETYIRDFLDASIAFCTAAGISPLFKIHPRDASGTAAIKQLVRNPLIAPQNMPIELFLFCERKPQMIIGARTTALHTTKALFPSVATAYFEQDDSQEGKTWIEFLNAVGIPTLCRMSEAAKFGQLN